MMPVRCGARFNVPRRDSSRRLVCDGRSVGRSADAARRSACATAENFRRRQAHGCMQTRRRLPHIYLENRWLFVTFHLHGSLPSSQYPPAHKTSGEAFVWIDRQLDTTRRGPMFLRQESIARVIVEALHRGADQGHYELGPFVIMSNRVHILIRPLIDSSRALKSLKGSTARAANRILGRTGEAFWQPESYDHWVRDEMEWQRIAAYIENNPVKAGLVSRPEDYRWSSAGVANSGDAARMSACATIGDGS
jgi:putative transposase